MLRVAGEILGDRLVALQARLVAVHLRRELIVGPLAYRSSVARRLVHRVAREAGQRPRRVARILETRRLDEAVVLAAGDAHHAIGPERVADETRIRGEQRLHRRRAEIPRRLREEPRLREVVARPIGQPRAVRLALAGPVLELPHAVTLSAHLRRPLRIEPRRQHRRRIGAAREVGRVAAKRTAIGRRMAGARPMARLAGNAELGDAAVDDLRLDRLRSERRVELRLAVRRMAGDTGAVPVARLGEECFSGRMQDRRAPRDPALLGDQVRRRKLAEQPVSARRVPVDLLMMRAGDHHDLPRDARTLRVCADASPGRTSGRAASPKSVSRTERRPPPPSASSGRRGCR